MFELENYIKRPNKIIRDICNLERDKEKYFINLRNEKEILKIRKDIDLNYLDGAIEIKYFSRKIIGVREWDLIDKLWINIRNLIEECLLEKESEVYFPDQPLLMKLKLVNKKYVVFTVGGESINLPKKEFFNFMLLEAENFFNIMEKYFGQKI